MASSDSDSTLLTDETDDSLSNNGSSDGDGGNAAIAGGSGAGDPAVVWLRVLPLPPPELPRQLKPFREVRGPCHAPAHDASCLAYAQLFITVELITMLVSETNRYASQYGRQPG